MTANAKRYGIGRTRSAETRRGESGVENGGVRGATGAGHGIPSRRARREKRRAAGRVCLSLARRYNTLDLAGKVSVPRGCGPFGNLGDEERRSLGVGTVCFPSGAATGVRFRTSLSAEGSRRYVWAAGQRGRGTFCESVITHYDTFYLPVEFSKVPWARALRLWTPGRGTALHPAQRQEAMRSTAWLPALRGWCALVRSGATGVTRHETGYGIVVRMGTKEHQLFAHRKCVSIIFLNPIGIW